MIALITRHKLLSLLLVALLVRVSLLIALYPSLFAFERTGAIHGSGAYDTYAVNLLASGIYGKEAPGIADAHLPPLFSYLLAGIYALLGRSGFAVGVVNIAFDLITIAALYHICRRLLPQHGESIGLLAAIFYAFYPYLLFQNLTVIDTPLFMMLLYLWLLTMIILRQRPTLNRDTWLLAGASGVLLGLMALVRTNAVLLAPLLAIWFLFRRSFWASAARLSIVAIISALVIAPWIIRNYRVYGEFIPVALNGGENLYQGNNPLTVPVFRAGYDVQWVPPPEHLPPARMTPERSAALAEAAWEYLRANPGAIPELMWTKFLVHWSIPIAPARNPTAGELPRLDYQGDAIHSTDAQGNLVIEGLPQDDPVNAYSESLFDVIGRTIHVLYYGALFILALAGCFVLRHQWREVSLIWLVQFAMTFIYVLFHPSTRYRVPTDPLLFVLSAAALVCAWSWWRARRAAAIPALRYSHDQP
jgi:4-amino-4-deoxy-L-arabinose transferase-like glycosyltransferase